MDTMKVLVGAVIFAGMMIVALPVALWHAFAIQILWGWYVTPIFHVPAPNLFAVAGLWLIPNSLTVHMSRSWDIEKDPTKKLQSIAFYWLLGPPVLILGGWIYHFWANLS